MNTVEALTQNAHLAWLPPADRQALADAFQVEELDDGHILIEEGKPGDSLYLLLSGKLCVWSNYSKKDVLLLSRLDPGSLCGILAIVDNEPRSATCTADGPVRVARLSRDRYQNVSAARPEIGVAFQFAIGVQIARDFRAITQRIHGILCWPTTVSDVDTPVSADVATATIEAPPRHIPVRIEPEREAIEECWNPDDAERIASLDPLNAWPALKNLPLLNEQANVDQILSNLKAILPTLQQTAEMDFFVSAAAMRDIGMYLGSIRRHGVEPQEVLAELGQLLPALAAPTGLPPRDNVLHYVSWNPAGQKMRMYTRFEEERQLIRGVHRIAPIVFSVVDALRELRTLPTDSDRFRELTGVCVQRTRVIVDAIRQVRQDVDPVVFACELRPYFDPIFVNGVEYKGPGAVEIPLFIIDHLLWSSGIDDSLLKEFQETYLPDQLPYLRECFLKARGKPSLVDRILQEIEFHESPPLSLWESAKNVHDLLEILVRFRGPHLFLARKAYNAQSQTEYTKGSGGYEPDVVKAILDLTVSSRKRVRDVLQRAPTEVFQHERLPSWYPKDNSTS